MEGKKKKYLIKSYKQMFLVIGIFTLVLLVGGTTFAFFNYTRTGGANTVKVGRIYFNHQEGDSISLENVFPISSEQAETDNVNAKTLSITVVGDTDYDKGIEYLLTLDSVNNTVNNKKVPINLEVSVTGEGLGTAETGDYYTNRDNYTESKYKIEYNDKLEQDRHLLVGYISPNTTKGTIEGINGTINIKAYLDKDKVAISDTYPESEPEYQLNKNMTPEELDKCANYINEISKKADYLSGTLEDFCNGLGTINGMSFQQMLQLGPIEQVDIETTGFSDNSFNYFIQENILVKKDDYSNGTTTEWIDGRMVLTTDEWNSLANTPLSFKIKVEANEGIWVPEPAQGTIDSCPGCKFIYSTTQMWTTWNTNSETPTQITSGYSENYNDIVTSSGKNYFLGVVTNNNNEVTNAYACGVKDDIPFCIEGTSDGSKYTANQTLINGANLWNNTCNVGPLQTGPNTYDDTQRQTLCGDITSSSLLVETTSNGNVFAGVGDSGQCFVASVGFFVCTES